MRQQLSDWPFNETAVPGRDSWFATRYGRKTGDRYSLQGQSSDGIYDFSPVQMISYHSQKNASCPLFNQQFKEKSRLATHWVLCCFVLDAMLFY